MYRYSRDFCHLLCNHQISCQNHTIKSEMFSNDLNTPLGLLKHVDYISFSISSYHALRPQFKVIMNLKRWSQILLCHIARIENSWPELQMIEFTVQWTFISINGFLSATLFLFIHILFIGIELLRIVVINLPLCIAHAFYFYFSRVFICE